MDDEDITKQDKMGGPRGEWFLWIILVFVVVAIIASWAGGWWGGKANVEEAPAAAAWLLQGVPGGPTFARI